MALLADMLEAARAVVRFTTSRRRDDYSKDEMLRAAVERRIEVVGEAARHISDEFAAQHPEIEWRKIRATRHILAHDYGRIDDDIMWRIATIHAPAMIAILESLLPKPPP